MSLYSYTRKACYKTGVGSGNIKEALICEDGDQTKTTQKKTITLWFSQYYKWQAENGVLLRE